MATIFRRIGKMLAYMRGAAPSPSQEYRAPDPRKVHACIEEIPYLRLLTIERMEVDPQVALALFVRNGLLAALEVEPDPENTGNPQHTEWALDQWNKIWQEYGHKLIRAKIAGYAGFEVRWREQAGTLDIDSLHDFHPRDVRALVCGGQTVGFRINSATVTSKARDIFAPCALWTTYESRYGNPYGDTVMRPAYLPWYKKWMEHGVEKASTLYMLKFAAKGDRIWVPFGEKFTAPDGTEYSYRDLMREVADNRLSMGSMVLPMLKDDAGNKLIEYEDGGGSSGPNPFEWFADDNGKAIWKGLGVLPEVLEADGTGAFSGRSIPLLATLSILMTEGKEIFQAVRQQILEPGCWANFGGCDIGLRVKPLAETFKTDMQGEGGEGGGKPSTMVPNRPMIPHANGGNSMQFAEDDPRSPYRRHKFPEDAAERANAAAGALSELMRGRIGDVLKKKVES